MIQTGEASWVIEQNPHRVVRLTTMRRSSSNRKKFTGSSSGCHPQQVRGVDLGRGAHLVMADGSARFISENIDWCAFGALCTRAGGEIVGEL